MNILEEVLKIENSYKKGKQFFLSRTAMQELMQNPLNKCMVVSIIPDYKLPTGHNWGCEMHVEGKTYEFYLLQPESVS